MKVRNLVLVALFAALTVLGAKIQIPMVPVQITLQLLVCILAGMLLGPWLGSLSQALYIIIGLIGIPVFANSDAAGPAYVLQPSFGYLIGLIVGAFLCGLIVRKVKKLTFISALLAALACMLIVYAFGLPYLYFIMNQYLHKAISMGKAAEIGFLVFVPGDLLKCVVSALLIVKLRPALERAKLIEAR